MTLIVHYTFILGYSCPLRVISDALWSSCFEIMGQKTLDRLLSLTEYLHSRGQHLCKFIGTKESVSIRKELNSHWTGLGHQHGRRFIVLGHHYGHRDVMLKHFIDPKQTN